MKNILSMIYPIGLPIALSLTAYNAFLTGLIVLLKRRDKAGISYFISSFIIFLWGVGVSFMLHNDLPHSMGCAWGTFSQIMALLIPATWLHFVLVYTEQEKRFKAVLIGAYIVTFLILPFCLSTYFIFGYKAVVGVERYPIPGIAYIAFTVLFISIVSFSFLVFLNTARKDIPSYKKRDYLLVCLASMYGFGTGSLSLLPVYGINLPQYNLLIMPLWQIMLAIIMTRYRAFDLVELAEAAQKNKLAAIGTLAASMNHEIKNPLFIIRGLAETQIAKSREPNFVEASVAIEKSNDVLRRVHEQTIRAMDIMKRFSSFAKQTNEEIKNEAVSLKFILDRVVPLVNHDLEMKKIRLVLDIAADLPFVKLDIRDGEEIFFNLIVNAAQAIKLEANLIDGVIKIEAKEENGRVSVYVMDNGSGIPQNKLKRIFDPFYTTKSEGTGLGLYITRQLVERNAGIIGINSVINHGTVFRLKFISVYTKPSHKMIQGKVAVPASI